MAAIPFAGQCGIGRLRQNAVSRGAEKIEAQDHNDWISEPAIIERLDALGCRVTPEQLARWRGERLLPQAFQPGRGRGPGRSTASFHPVTVAQAARIKQLLIENLDFGPIGWRLWCEGYLVGDKYWKPIIQRARDQWDLFRDKMDEISDSDDDRHFTEIEGAIRFLFNMNNSNIVLNSLRMTLNSKRFESFAMAALNAASAGFNRSFDQTDPDTIEDNRTIDLAFSIKNWKNSGGEQIFQGAISEIFDHISVSMSGARLCFDFSAANNYIQGRIYLEFFRNAITVIVNQMGSLPKLFIRAVVNRKSPETDAILIALLPIVIDHLQKVGEVQPAMVRVIQLTRSIIGIEQNANGPKWLIPKPQFDAMMSNGNATEPLPGEYTKGKSGTV